MNASRRNIDHHYDLDEDLFRVCLDQEMHYSCAYFTHSDKSLEDAQLAKSAHIAAKLNLQPGQRVLDIGCGWGSMAMYLARHYDVEVTGLTLSVEQLRVAEQTAEARVFRARCVLFCKIIVSINRPTTELFPSGCWNSWGAKIYPGSSLVYGFFYLPMALT
jgi:cyclopropane fatty-acyl-phospholipid synthase-like methyltransferase